MIVDDETDIGDLYQLRLPYFPHAPRSVDATDRLFAPPRRTVACDREQVIRRRRIAAMRDRGRRGHADHGDGAVRPVDPYGRMNVIMAVEDLDRAIEAASESLSAARTIPERLRLLLGIPEETAPSDEEED